VYCLIFQVHYSILFTSHLLACLNVYVLLLQMASMDQGLRANAEQDVANGVNAGSGQTNAANGQTNAANGHSNAANGHSNAANGHRGGVRNLFFSLLGGVNHVNL